ncbi:uncharacterized protein LOC123703931 [Colias croceus]|uniref:uncharacterized protein LOC123703931 n=1 Tax=Colias crocea TaxID=72248 RepID=UPI001E280C05|nr:uncharacterized protein LOC123703931 [Colias croceus]
MPQRSTEDALYRLVNHIRNMREEKKISVVVSLDIEGAFDSAWWPAIKVRLAEVGCPANVRRVISSYLSERGVKVRYAGVEVSRGTSKGCVQGSIGGPILWNLLLDPLLWMLEEMGVFCQAFADDIVLVVEGDTALEIETKANRVLNVISEWGKENKLKFAPNKTCALLSTRRLKYDVPRLAMGNVEIKYYSCIKILGLTIDSGLTFNAHVGTRWETGRWKEWLRRLRTHIRQSRKGWGSGEDSYSDVASSHVHRIYTDGSKIEGRVGAALSVWEGEAETKAVKLALPSYCTVYQAELLALQRAVERACKSGVAKVGIFSDSRSALQAVTLGSPHPLAVQTRAALRKAALQRREVALFWIKAHAGLRGNERVDQLAKEAALGSKRKPDYDLCPVSFVKRILRQDTIGEWDGRYDVGETAGGTKLFFPSAAAAYKIVRKIDITHHTTQRRYSHTQQTRGTRKL